MKTTETVIRERFENNDLIPADYTSSSAFDYFSSGLLMLETWAEEKGISNFEAFEMFAKSENTDMRARFKALIKLLYDYELKA